MKVKYLFFLFIATVLVAGCAKENNSQTQRSLPEDNSQGQNQRGAGFAFQGELGSPEDLVIGQRIVVSGSAGSDGSITALSIRVGEFNPDENLQRFEEQSNNNAGSIDSQRIPEGAGSLPDGFSPTEGFNPEEFQNMSDEERRARFEEMRAQDVPPGGGNFGPGAGARAEGSGRSGGGVQIVQGEILNIDDTTITIKLVDGGSQFIFYSKDTQIVKQPEQQE